MNLLHEQLVAEHRRDIQREVEQQRLVANLPQSRNNMVRSAVGSLSMLLITVGTRLKQVELRNEQVAAG